MTIRKLKEMIQDLPDDMRVYADDSPSGSFSDGASEFVFLITDPCREKACILQTKKDMDVIEELRGLSEAAFEQDWSDQDFFTVTYDVGFTPDDFEDPAWAKENYERYGLI